MTESKAQPTFVSDRSLLLHKCLPYHYCSINANLLIIKLQELIIDVLTRSGLFCVGPESASAHPGPVCYRKGGPLAITDANLCLGRILPEYFPKIFGPTENEPLDKQGTLEAFDKLTQEINQFDESKRLTREEVAIGFIAVANEAMCRPIRALTQGKGYDTSRHALACFGGAGGQHACSIAR